jgi:hypothetical protein
MAVTKESYLRALDEGIPLPTMAGLDAAAPGGASLGGTSLGGGGGGGGPATNGGAPPGGGLSSSGGFGGTGGGYAPQPGRGSAPGSPRRVRGGGASQGLSGSGKGEPGLASGRLLSPPRRACIASPACEAPRLLPTHPPPPPGPLAPPSLQLDGGDPNRRSLARGVSKKVPGRVVTSVVDGLKAIYFQKVGGLFEIGGLFEMGGRDVVTPGRRAGLALTAPAGRCRSAGGRPRGPRPTSARRAARQRQACEGAGAMHGARAGGAAGAKGGARWPQGGALNPEP